MGNRDTPELLPGTLDLLILKTLQRGSMHGYGIAQRLKAVSGEVLHVGESSWEAHRVVVALRTDGLTAPAVFEGPRPWLVRP